MEELNFEIADEESSSGTRIKVIGIGGAGGNAVARMLADGVRGVEFHVLNTDRQAINACPVPNKLVIGSKLTRGLGAGADPEIGRQAALEDTDRIIEILEGADMVFITCGLGGGTGTGAAPVVAGLAKELNALTVAVVTKPFLFEGSRRIKIASRGLTDLAGTVDTIITVPNEKLMSVAGKGTSFVDAYRTADDVLRQAVQGISDIITTPGLVNRDFADIRAIMAGMGHATMGTAIASGENATTEAARNACSGALMDQQSIEGAAGLLINITGSSSLGLHDVHEACSAVGAQTKNEDVRINFGVVIDETLKDSVKVTVIATGFGRPSDEPRRPEIRHTVFVPPIAASLPSLPIDAIVEDEDLDDRPGPIPEFAPTTPEPPPTQVEVKSEETGDLDDLDTPAFLRRDRRLFQ